MIERKHHCELNKKKSEWVIGKQKMSKTGDIINWISSIKNKLLKTLYRIIVKYIYKFKYNSTYSILCKVGEVDFYFYLKKSKFTRDQSCGFM